MEIRYENCSCDEKILNFKIDDSNIIGITGLKKDKFLDLLKLESLPKGNIYYNNEKVTKLNIWSIKRKIAFISEGFIYPQFVKNVLDYMIYYMRKNNVLVKDDQKKINGALKIVGLEKDYLTKDLFTLSTSEKKLVQIASCLLSNPELIIFEEPFLYFDLNNQKQLFFLMQRLQEQHNKNILIVSKDSNILYKYTKQMIFIKNNDIIATGNTKEMYQKIEWLNKNKITVPEIVLFTHKAKKEKNVKIDYHQDIRDIIKDIYKHV